MKRIKQLLIIFTRGILFRVRVSGESCWPVLVPGKAYWASALARIQKGDFIVFTNPADREQILVKKILSIQKRAYEVGSTVSWGLSGKDFGLVDKKSVLGKIIR